MSEPYTEPDLPHFQAIPWCSSLLSRPNYVLTPTFSRIPKPENEDSLFAFTLKSSSTITHILSFYPAPSPSSSSDFLSEVYTLVTLSTGLNGGPNALHGGVISTLLDDVMGTLLTINKSGGRPLSDSTVTKKMEVVFERMVSTPGTYLVGAKCTRREGRKFWIEGWLEDGGGRRCARGESLWINVVRDAVEKKARL
jgi:acyl-coenzyme A thioesterase PaaI-like protein